MSSNNPYLITGAGKDVQPRLEIRKLVLQKQQFTLFVLAWNEIRKTDYKPAAARYGEQAGIHGMPYQPWLGDPKGQPKEGDDVFRGYCNHGSVLFPTWHRPSLMLLEQSISEAAYKLADGFAKDHPEEASVWRDAAHKLRFPYWDWTMDPGNGPSFPQIFREPTVNLQMPKGATKSHPNPLYTYDLGSPLPKGFVNRQPENDFVPPGLGGKLPRAFYGQWKRTYRWPTQDPNNPTEEVAKLESFLNPKQDPNSSVPRFGSWQDLKRQVSALFLYPEDLDESDGVYAWDAFSNTSVMSQPTELDWVNPGKSHYWDVAKKLKGKGSIEEPHNLLHLLIGGLGHMMDNDYASFDPIFFLHHCNVDRIIALWEQAYPKYFMGNSGYKDKNGNTQQFKQIWGKFGWKDAPKKNPNNPREPVFSAVDLKGDTPLTPFRKADGSYWTSDDTRWQSKVPKNYTYEDIHVTESVLDPLRPKAGITMNLSLGRGSFGAALGGTQHFVVQSTQDQTPQVESARGSLQKLFGFNPVLDRQQAYEELGESRRLVYPENRKPLSQGYDAIYDIRHFVVRIRLDPFVYGFSYLVNIGYKALDANRQTTLSGHIGSAAVLTRSKDTQCAACQGKRDAEVKSMYTIVIPHEIITKLALHSSEMEVVPLLQKSLCAEIAFPGGYTVAQASATAPENATPIPEELVPEFTLHSSALQALFDGTEHDRSQPQDHAPLTPCETYDWQYHGDLFPAQTWAAA
ncbi:hypothetical protein OPQ81_005099 [Rhizoctonia solani]|nr:hypothetical protein OPQ81_005099 [Rhizoctonia solani]